jgi:F-type H+-transporting ATPase subunit b
MLIDWFTVAAQTVNFLILVWLLKRFLYKPILLAIDAREQRIATELADAAAKQTEAKAQRDVFVHKNHEFDQQRDKLMQQVNEDAEAEQQRLLADARQAAEALSVEHQQSMARDARNLKQTLSRKTTHEVFAIARKTLADMATTSLEQQVGEVFIRRLSELDPQAKTKLAEALKTTSASEPALLRSAFELPEIQRGAIQNALNVTFSADIPLTFEIAEDLISGIELRAKGQKLVWSIADYLELLEQSVEALIQQKIKPENKVKAVAKTEKS